MKATSFQKLFVLRRDKTDIKMEICRERDRKNEEKSTPHHPINFYSSADFHNTEKQMKYKSGRSSSNLKLCRNLCRTYCGPPKNKSKSRNSSRTR